MNVSSVDAAEDMTITWNLFPISKPFWEGMPGDDHESIHRIGDSKSHYYIEGTSESPSVYLEK